MAEIFLAIGFRSQLEVGLPQLIATAKPWAGRYALSPCRVSLNRSLPPSAQEKVPGPRYPVLDGRTGDAELPLGVLGERPPPHST